MLADFHLDLTNMLIGLVVGIVVTALLRLARLSRDPRLVAELRNISQSHRDNWTEEWIERCLADSTCRRVIRDLIDNSEVAGWEPVSIDFDNHGNGVHINLNLEKEFVLEGRRA